MADEISDHKIRERAYYLWDQAGRPEGRDEEFWRDAAQELGEPGAPVRKDPLAGESTG